MNLSRYWHTLRYLKPRQVVGRIQYRLQRPSPEPGPAPQLREFDRRWPLPAWRQPSLLAPDVATFLNRTATIGTTDDWNAASDDRLWVYNLHYFDDLTSRDFDSRRSWHEALVQRWIRENPPGVGTGWEPYPTSLRITNWIKWWLASPSVPAALRDVMAQSLAIQARWLTRRLEVHLLGNHLWTNAKALLMAGAVFDGPEAASWRRRGAALLAEELDAQILADGGHVERSPMYHATVLEDVLDLVYLAKVLPDAVPTGLPSVATRMLRWQRTMTHPDGDLSFFNDAAFGIAAPYAVLAAYARALDVHVDERPLAPLEVLAESGYVRLQNERAVVLCDVAPVGPDYQPGHAHADTLSFELSVDRRRVVVNGGTSTYTPGSERSRQRGTAAHSTVEVDGENSSDVWAGFRVGRRARPLNVKTGMSPEGVWVEAAHDGYRHRPGRVIHHRRWWLDTTGLTVTDRIDGTFVRAVSRFLLHPEAGVSDATTVRVEPLTPAVAVRVPTTWHPEFGRALETQCVEVEVPSREVTTRVVWS